jgi:FkbM family methyltransferase
MIFGLARKLSQAASTILKLAVTVSTSCLLHIYELSKDGLLAFRRNLCDIFDMEASIYGASERRLLQTSISCCSGRSMLNFAKSALRRALPHQVEWLAKRRHYWTELRHGERELTLLDEWVDKRVALDVGANVGTYAYHLSKLTEVIAFEPNPQHRWILSKLPRNVRVENVALSDREGMATLHIPLMSNGQQADGWATLESVPSAVSVTVPMHTLDSYNLDPGFIKIDVEGHEEAVLDGALQTIRRSKPVLLIECEERHNRGVTSRLPAFLATEGYAGFFYPPGRGQTPISEFNCSINQPTNINFEGDLAQARKVYANNFLFMPHDR